jgi:hypothetical protein
MPDSREILITAAAVFFNPSFSLDRIQPGKPTVPVVTLHSK